MRRTDSLCLASWIAREQEVVVLPTPPFPPTKIHLSDSARALQLAICVEPRQECGERLTLVDDVLQSGIESIPLWLSADVSSRHDQL